MSGLSRVGSSSYVLSTHRDELVEERNIVDVAKTNDTMELLILLRKGRDPNEQDEAGYTPLHWFARHNNVKATMALIIYGANPYLKNYREFTPIREAAAFSSREAVRAVLGAYEKFNRSDSRLPNAVERKDYETVLQLLEERVNLLSKDKNGRTALEFTLDKKFRRIGFIVFECCKRKGTNLEEGPLHDSVRYNDVNALKMMLSEGANTEDRDVIFNTPFLLAASLNKLSAMRILLEAGADHRKKNLYGQTALHLAVLAGNAEEVALLLSLRGIDVNAQTFDSKKTPLHYAKEFHPELIPLLLEHGANRFILDAKGKDCQLNTEDSIFVSSVY